MKQRAHELIAIASFSLFKRRGLIMKKTKGIKKLTLRQDVIRTLTSAELKTVIAGVADGTCNSGTSSNRTQEEAGSPTTC